MKTIELRTGVKIQDKQKAIRQLVLKKIKNGEYTEKLPGLRGLARDFSVNVITLRKALSSLIKDGLIYAESGKGIFVNSKRKICIGIIGSGHEKCLFDKGEYFGDVFAGIHDKLENNNNFFSYQLKRSDRTYRELIRENPSVAGLIIFAPIKIEEKELTAINGLIPCIIVGTTPINKTINSVDSDNYNDSRNAVKQLVREGNRKILFLSGKMYTRTHELRCNGYLAALAECGIEADKKMIVTESPGRDLFKNKILSRFNSKNPPTAIFAANCYSAVELLEIDEVRKKKFKLIAYDDPKNVLSKFGVEYRVVQQPLYEIGRTAVKRLYDLIQNKNLKTEQIKLSSRLINKKEKS